MLTRPPKTTLYVAIATALSLLGDQALYALLPIYFETLGLVPFQVGILLSANRWIRLYTNHVAERLTRRYPVRLLFGASLLLGALLTGAYAFVTSFTVLLLARCLWGLCWSFIRHISVMEVAAGSKSGNLGQMMGYYNGISRIGSVAGIVLGGVLFDLVGFVTTMTLFCLLSLLALLFVTRAGDESAQAGSRAWQSERAPVPHHALLVCGFCIGSVGPGLLMSTLGFILLSRYGAEVSVLGMVVGVATLNGLILGCRWILDSIGAPVYGAVIDRVGVHTGAPAAFLTGMVVLLLVSVGSGLGGMVAGVIVFFICGTALATVVAAEASRLGSRIYARYASAGDLGSAFGPVVGWTAYELWQAPDLTFILGAGLYALGFCAALLAFRRTVGGVSATPGRATPGRATPGQDKSP